MDFTKLINFEEKIKSYADVFLDFSFRFGVSILVLVLGLYLISKVSKLLKKILLKREFDPSLVSFINSLFGWTLRVLLLISIASMIGLVTTSFVTIVGAAGLAVGLALQGSLSNFAGGVVIMLFKPFKTGDYIKAQDTEGTVTSIDIFATRLLDFENIKVIIPNGALANGTIVNYTAENIRRTTIPIGISYKDNISVAIKALTELCVSHPQVVKEPAPMVVVSGYGDSSINLSVRAWMETDNYWQVLFDLTAAIKPALDNAGIAIPFPQRDVHVYKENLDV